MYLANRVNTAERQIDRLQFDVRAVDNAVDVFAAERAAQEAKSLAVAAYGLAQS